MLQKSLIIPLLILSVLSILSCKNSTSTQKDTEQRTEELDMSNIFAWCIVPFDSVERTPVERIKMLHKLGIQSYAYDWRTKHLETMEKELGLAKANNIEVNAIWMWIDANSDQPDSLSSDNEKMLSIVEKSGLKTDIWLGFNANYFENLNDVEAVEKGKEMIGYLHNRLGALGCRLVLYNHGDWFGEPANQVKIIKALGEPEIGIVYSFHHAHEQIDHFDTIVEEMLPYLWAVNLNGMRKEGPKILPIGAGDHEAEMLQKLQKAGYDGPLGILGHVEEADVEVILKQNLEGLRSLKYKP